MHSEFLSYWLLTFASFFTLINPLGTMPIYMTMTAELTAKEQERVARKASLVMLLIILFFAWTGLALFQFFGISIASLKVVGGIIFLLVGMDMLQARLVRTKVNETEVKKYVNDISITPLAIPMLCGPGAITNAIVMWSGADTLDKQIAMLVAVVVITALVYFILRWSGRISRVLGETGGNVMMRIMGLIVMVIAVEFFFSGIKALLHLE